MRQLRSFGDEREVLSCVYCGNGPIESRDHVPSRVLLDEPYPENLPVVPACAPCNNGFSQDEEYVACLVECVIAGTTDPKAVTRSKVARILRERPALAARLAAARTVEQGGTVFGVEDARVRKVVLKLARGHASFELHTPQTEEPSAIAAVPLVMWTEAQRRSFECGPSTSIWPEVGSRAMQRLVEDDGFGAEGWVVAQPGRYRYLAVATEAGPIVRIVLSEYLACEVHWDLP
jgi:hypothetical protein